MYTDKGFQFTDRQNRFQLQIGGRLQFRFATPNDQDPITYDDFFPEEQTVFKINRARLKVGGFTFKPWLKYYFEYELSANRLLDFRVMIEKWPWMKFKLGQWKIEYTRERVISSGKQQLMERSIINRPFTLDRQQGISIYGRIKASKLADFNYHLSILTGSGINARENDDGTLLYTGRVQWNPFGEPVPMIGSDLEHREKPIASIAVAGASNSSQYTRFSSSGGGYLTPDVPDGMPGKWHIKQGLLETSLMYRSFSWHSELHVKKIEDKINQNTRQLRGGFWQAGYMLNQLIDNEWPLLEIAFRFAVFSPDIPNFAKEETSLAFNSFFNGHLNKLTADISFFEYQNEETSLEAQSWRFRMQYEVSF